MGIFSKFEDRMEDTVEGAASRVSKAPISPVQIAKKAEKQMRRETMVGAGKEYAPTLYTVLVNPDDDSRLFGYYPTLAGETETYLSAKATQNGLVMDGNPLVRFIVDDGLRHGKFEVIAEVVAAPIVAELRAEEMERYGLSVRAQRGPQGGQANPAGSQQRAQQPQGGYAPQPEPNSYGNAQSGQYGYAQPQPGPEPYGHAQQQPESYGYAQPQPGQYGYAQPQPEPEPYGYAKPQPEPQPAAPESKPPLPYVPEEEIDRSIDYGEYTFNSEDFEDYRSSADDGANAPVAYNDAFAAQAADAFASTAVPPDVALPAQAMSGKEPVHEDQPHMQPANTVAFTAGSSAGAGQAVPDQRTVRARLVDLTYHRPYDLAGTRVTIGRESSNDIKVQDINASRRHADLTLNQQGLWVITDLSSMNGTLVNGVSVASQPLYPGDVVTIGKTDFEFALV